MNAEELDQLAELVAEKVKASSPAPQDRGRERKRKQQKLPAYLTEEEIGNLFSVISDPRDRAIFSIAYYRGLRASELGMINVGDYQPSFGRLVIRRLKGSLGGEYHVTEAERAALKAWLRKRGSEPGPLFGSRNHGGIKRGRLHQLMRRYCAAAGIPMEKAHMHALKHSCGTHLSAIEGDVRAIQDHLGHAQIQNTMKYLQVSSRRRHEFAEKLGRDGWGSKGLKKPK